jgi:hypothetical protein
MRNIGIACKPSGLLVVDCDVKPDGDGYMEWLEKADKLSGGAPVWETQETLQVTTGGGGLHVYYQWPPGVQASQAGLDKHVDIRSNGGERGGYVLGAGSITDKGTYAVEYDPGYIKAAPGWLIEWCREKPRPAPLRSPIEQPAALSFAGLQTAVQTAVEGNRNAMLFYAARAMYTDGADYSKALELLIPAAVDNGLTEREATDTIRSGYRLQRLKDG